MLKWSRYRKPVMYYGLLAKHNREEMRGIRWAEIIFKENSHHYPRQYEITWNSRDLFFLPRSYPRQMIHTSRCIQPKANSTTKHHNKSFFFLRGKMRSLWSIHHHHHLLLLREGRCMDSNPFFLLVFFPVLSLFAYENWRRHKTHSYLSKT